jgi:hypothetical protein
MAIWTLKLNCRLLDYNKAEQLNKIFIPDSINIPRGMSYKQYVQNNTLLIYIVDTDHNRIRSTADEILAEYELLYRIEKT